MPGITDCINLSLMWKSVVCVKSANPQKKQKKKSYLSTRPLNGLSRTQPGKIGLINESLSGTLGAVVTSFQDLATRHSLR